MENLTTYEQPKFKLLDPMKSTYHINGSIFTGKSTSMKAIRNPQTECETVSTVNIKLLVDKLIKTVLKSSISRRNLILNEIPAIVQLPINENKLALIIGSIINTIISSTHDDYLHICSFQKGEIILRVENTDLSRNRSFILFLESTLIIAEKLGITLKIEDYYGKGSDVSLRFLKQAA